jgi:hypothetical protein
LKESTGFLLIILGFAEPLSETHFIGLREDAKRKKLVRSGKLFLIFGVNLELVGSA